MIVAYEQRMMSKDAGFLPRWFRHTLLRPNACLNGLCKGSRPPTGTRIMTNVQHTAHARARVLRASAIAFVLSALAGCGESGGDSTHVVSVKVSGLEGSGLVL